MLDKGENHQVYKIAIYGPQKSGKTSLANVLSGNEFPQEHMFTSLGKDFHIAARDNVTLQLWDTAPRNPLEELKANYNHRGTKAYIIAFDPTQEDSTLNNISKQIEVIKKSAIDKNTPIIIISTKSDLPNPKFTEEDLRENLRKDPIKYENVTYLGTCSAKRGDEMDTLFDKIVGVLDPKQQATNSCKKYKSLLTHAKKEGHILSTEKECVEAFNDAHQARRQSEYFKFARSSKIEYKETLDQILKHAASGDNRSRKVCIDLKWMDNKGELLESAPGVVKDAFSKSDSSVLKRF